MVEFKLNKVKPIAKHSDSQVKNISKTFAKKVILESESLDYKVGKVGQIIEEKYDEKDLTIFQVFKILENSNDIELNNITDKITKGGWTLTNKKIITMPLPSKPPIATELHMSKNNIKIYICYMHPEGVLPGKYSLYLCKGEDIVKYETTV